MQILKVCLIKDCWVSNYVFSRLLCSNNSRMFYWIFLTKSMPHELYILQSEQPSEQVLFQLEAIFWF